jgi:hypothetical protein
MCGQQFARAILLNHPTQPLPDVVRRHFDLIIMRRAGSLIESLQLTGDSRRMAENLCQPVFEFLLFRVHASLL